MERGSSNRLSSGLNGPKPLSFANCFHECWRGGIEACKRMAPGISRHLRTYIPPPSLRPRRTLNPKPPQGFCVFRWVLDGSLPPEARGLREQNQSLLFALSLSVQVRGVGVWTLCRFAGSYCLGLGGLGLEIFRVRGL